MKTDHLVGVIGLAAMLAALLPLYIRAWRGDTTWMNGAERAGIPLQTARSVMRCGCSAIPAIALVLVLGALGELTSGPDGRWLGVFGEPIAGTLRSLVMGILVFAMVIVNLSVFFNRPRFLVPPVFRKDEGLWRTLYGRNKRPE